MESASLSEESQEVIAEVKPMLSTMELWQWEQFLKKLDDAGYVVSKKPELKGVGRPHRKIEGGPEG